MPGRSWPVRVGIENGEEFKRQFEALGLSGEQAMDRIKKALPALGEIMDRHAADPAKRAKDALDRLGGSGKPAADGLKAAGQASQQLGEQTKLSAAQIQNLSYQVNDIAVQLAGGQNPFLVMLQQGSQITPVFGGIANTLRALVTPLNLAVAGAAALGGGFALLVSRAAQAEQQFRTFNVAMDGTGRPAEVLRTQFAGLVDQIARIPGVSRDAAAELLAGLARNRQIGADLYADIVKIGAGYAKAFGTDAAQGVEAFAKVLASPAEQVKGWAEQTGRLSAEQVRLVQSLDNSGQRIAAQRTIIESARGQFGDLASKGMSEAAKAADSFGKAWDDLLNRLSKTGPVERAASAVRSVARGAADALNTPTPEAQIYDLSAQYLNAQMQGVSGSYVGPLRTRLNRLIGDQDAARNDALMRDILAAGVPSSATAPGAPPAVGADLARLRAITGEALPGLLPTEYQRRQITDQRAAFRSAIDNSFDALIAGSGGQDLGQLYRGLQQVDANLAGTMTPTQLAQLQAASASRVAGAGGSRAIVAAQESARLAAITGNVPEGERGAFIAAKTQEALAPVYGASREQVDTLAEQVRLEREVAEAYKVSTAAGREREIVAARELENFRNRTTATRELIDLDKQLAAADALKDLRRDNLALEDQVAAEKRVTEARKISNAAAEDAARANEIAALRKRLEAQVGSAELTPALEAEIDRRRKLTAELQNNARADRIRGEARSAQDDVRLAELELSLLGHSAEERGRIVELEREKLRLAREYGDTLPQEQAQLLRLREQYGAIRGQIEDQRKAQELWLEPIKSGIQGVQKAWADGWEATLRGNVRSFGDFFKQVKDIGIRTLAEILGALSTRALLQGVLGGTSLGGMLGLPSGGGGAGAGGMGIGGLLSAAGSGLNWLSGGSLGNVGSSIAQTLGLASAAGGGGASSLTSFLASPAANPEAASAAYAGLSGAGFSWAGPAALAATVAGQFISGRAGNALSFGGAGLGLAAMLGAGPIGLAAAAVGGGLLGGLLGGKKPSVGPNGTAGVLLEGDGGRLIGRMTSGDNGFDGGAVVGYSQQAARALQDLAEKLGTTTTGAAQGAFQQGREGIRYGFWDAGLGPNITAGDDPVGEYVRAAIQRGALAGVSQVDESLIAAAVGGKLEEAFLAVQRQQVGSELQAAISGETEIAQGYGRARAGLAATRDALRIDANLSPLSNEARLAEARGQFAAIVGRAQAGDLDALSQAQSFGPSFLRELRSYYGPSEQYAGEFQQTLNTFGSLESMAAAREQSATRAIERMTDQLANIGTKGNEELQGIRAELQGVRQEIAATRSAAGGR